MECPDCKGNITCRLSLRTEMEDRPVEISYQWWECTSCGKKYYALLEDSHVNMFDDRLEHKGYYADEETWKRTLAAGLKCPDQSNTACGCPLHKSIPPPGFHGVSAWYTYE